MTKEKSNSRTANEYDLKLGQLIKQQRILLKLSQKDVAKELNITPQQYKKYEAGIDRISFGRVVELSKIIGNDIVIPFFFTEKENREMQIGKAVENILKNN